MNSRLLRITLFVAGLCLALTHAPAAQTRHPRAKLPRAHPQAVIPGLSVESRASIAGAQAVNVPWFDSLETGGAGWTKDGFWHIPFKPQLIEVLSPAINPTLVLLPDSGFLPAPHSGNNAFWYGEDVTGTYIGSDFTQVIQTPLDGGTSNGSNTGSAITPLINLVGQKTPLLSFWTWWEIEGIATSAFDLMNVEVSADSGLTWNPLGRGLINPLDDDANQDDWKSYSSGGLGQKGKWIQEYFDLTGYVGSVVMIRFRFETLDDEFNGFRGWFIDDIGVGAAGAPAPTITQVTPAVVIQGQLLGVIGTNFVNGASIYVDTTLVGSLNAGVVSTAFAQFYVPAVGPGAHSVRIVNPDGKSAVKQSAFTVTTDVPPVLQSVTPDSALAGVSTPITITGSNFAAGVTVDIGGIPATGVQLVGSTQINAVSPNKLAPGVYDVTVLNTDGLSDVSILGFRVFTPGVSVVATGDSLAG
ncbi:MAG TPA: IPT/TIG domain-containing protein, partial [Bacteroidota bacterium]|nr:IPT/TIG domain-containing protein [Bacteroidota bacterium]